MGDVLVTGVTGTVGSAVAASLVDAGESVTGAVRHPTSRAGRVESRRLDFTAPTNWDELFDGIDRLFLVRPPAIADVASTLLPMIDEALRRGVTRIAFLSLQGVQFNRSTPHHAVETHLKKSGADYTFLRPNFFLQNLSTTYAAEIRDTGHIIVPAGRARTAFIDARDIGLAAAAVLTEAGHERKAYTLSGEESLDYHQVAETMTRVLGRPIVYTNPSADEYEAHLRAGGYPEDYIAVQRMIYRIVRLGVSARPDHSVEKLTGRPARRLPEFVNDYRGAWTGSR